MKHRFKHQGVSDLAWVMACPGLLANAVTDEWCARALSAHGAALVELDRDPSPLVRYLAGRGSDRRLGAYFEALVGYWLSKLLKMQNVRDRVQVRVGKVTVGEHDFLFRDPARPRPVHWEVAVKFYMYEGSITGDLAPDLGEFHGPNARDSLQLKVDRLYDHQLKLSSEYEAEAFVKGVLFYPAALDWRRLLTSATVNPSHRRGWWCSQADFAKSAEYDGAHWVLLTKTHWLGALSEEALTNLTIYSGSEAIDPLSRAFNETTRAVMVARLEQSENKTWIEASRGFIVRA